MAVVMKNRNEINDSIRQIFLEQLGVYVWDINSNAELVKAPVCLSKISISKNKLTFTLDKATKSYLHDLVKGSGKLKFFVKSKLLAFESVILSFDSYEELIVKLPHFFEYFDRRSHSRQDVLSPMKFRFIIGEKKLEALCDDISVSGCSILVKDNTKDFFNKKDQVLKSVILYENMEIPMELKIVNINKLTNHQNHKMPYANRRITFSYFEIDDRTKMSLQNILNTEKEVLAKFSR